MNLDKILKILYLLKFTKEKKVVEKTRFHKAGKIKK